MDVTVENNCQTNDKVQEWIITVENNTKTFETLQCQPPKLHKVPDILKRKPTNSKDFIPEVVSLGPYHHLSPHLQPMESHKMAAMVKFIGNPQAAEVLLGKIKGVVKQPKDWYVGMDHLGDDEFARMMLVDACFILYFIQNFGMAERNPKEEDTTPISPHLCGFITRDIFLLENQIPYCILKELIKFKYVDLDCFIDKIIGTEGSNRGSGIIAEPLHLLDLLHSRWIGKTSDDNGVGVREPNWSTFRSVMELKEAGITIGRSTTRHLTNVRFNADYIWGKLTIPTFVVDDVTKSRLLNLVALEMHPGRPTTNGRPGGRYVVTSYICFLDNLIDHEDDVKELRLQGILYNALGNDQEVADLFNELAVNLVPDYRLYSLVVKGLDSHYNRKFRVLIVTMLNKHFSSPWSAISFVAAVVLLVLTFLQTMYSIMGNGK